VLFFIEHKLEKQQNIVTPVSLMEVIFQQRLPRKG
jgi:hypothetical protein